MNPVPARAAAIATAMILMTCEAPAVTFDERWSSMFGVNQVSSETVAAKAELVRPKEAKREKSVRHHRVRRSRAGRHREWYKGGKKWHYVYSRRRGR